MADPARSAAGSPHLYEPSRSRGVRPTELLTELPPAVAALGRPTNSSRDMNDTCPSILRCRSRSRSLRTACSNEAIGDVSEAIHDASGSDKDCSEGNPFSTDKETPQHNTGTPSSPRPLNTVEESSLGTWNMISLSILLLITFVTMPSPLQTQNPTVLHVWYYGWISAISTGFGAVPFYFWSHPSGRWLGVSNAVAGGMMLSASYSLVSEAFELDCDRLVLFGYPISQLVRTLIGCACGMGFVAVCQKYLEDHDDLSIGAVSGLEVSCPPCHPHLSACISDFAHVMGRRPRSCSWWA